jgi:hypothetical protein
VTEAEYRSSAARDETRRQSRHRNGGTSGDPNQKKTCSMRLTCLERHRYPQRLGMRLLCHTAASAHLNGRLHVEHETTEARPCPDRSPAPRSVHFSAEWTIVSWKPRLLLCQLCGARYSPFRAPKIEEAVENCSIAEEIVRARPRVVLCGSKSMSTSIQKHLHLEILVMTTRLCRSDGCTHLSRQHAVDGRAEGKHAFSRPDVDPNIVSGCSCFQLAVQRPV